MSIPAPPSLPRYSGLVLSPPANGSDREPGLPSSRFILRYIVADGPAKDLCTDLAQRSGLSKTRVKQTMTKGAVWIKPRRGRRRRVRRATTRPQPGDRIALYYDATILARQPPRPECVDDHRTFSVWFKPAGMLTQGTHFGDHCSLLRTVQTALGVRRPVFPVHRLDREAQGLILIAHDRRTAASLSAMFRRRQITKGYHADLKGDLGDKSGLQIINTPLDGKSARTRYRVIGYDPETHRTRVEIWIETGRRHQIRRHFNGIGHPLLGDPRYGHDNPEAAGLRLWATSLAFICPRCARRHIYRHPPPAVTGAQDAPLTKPGS